MAVRGLMKAGDIAMSDDRKTRMESDINVNDPELKNSEREAANQALVTLPKKDPDMAVALREHLAIPFMDQVGPEPHSSTNHESHNPHHQEMALHQELQGDRDSKQGEHTLRPSLVSKQAHMENARLRLKKRIGEKNVRDLKANRGKNPRIPSKVYHAPPAERTGLLTGPLNIRENHIPQVQLPPESQSSPGFRLPALRENHFPLVSPSADNPSQAFGGVKGSGSTRAKIRK